MLYLAILRSPHAHARITGIDLSAGRTPVGVRLAVAGTRRYPDREHGWRHEIASPHFDRIEIKIPDSSLDRPFGDGGGLRPPVSAIGVDQHNPMIIQGAVLDKW
jgi:CO/xanthine dehydrogenase Mo-binding subunit